jgi:alpha-N-arabinofuranosidase
VKSYLCSGLVLGVGLLLSVRAGAAEFHVATTGSDAAQGSKEAPWQTIQKAAATLMPGDTCIVHAGTYREWVNPARGGTAQMPIKYEGAKGEDVFVKGSNQLTTWALDSGQVWKVVVPTSTFGTFNPYSAVFSGDYMTAGANYHQGNVYLNGKAYSEVLTQAEVGTTADTWYAEVTGDSTTIWANFGAAKPNDELAEINVRKSAFFPSTLGLDYIEIRGFHILHGATNWAPPTAYPQEGLIMMNFGLGWVIENNYISDAKTVCVSGGLGSGNAGQGINQVGNHVIRHNTIERCGQAGIAGSHGMVASLIEGNLIQDINPTTTHVGGWEAAGIKIHSAIDVVIRGNVIRRVRAGALGIWLDWQAQGSRITGNVFYDIEQDVLKFEADHGPTLVDNNIFEKGNVADVSEHSIFVHNLFSQTGWAFGLTDTRTPEYFKPHTTETAGSAAHAAADNKYFNNIYVGAGSAGVPQQPGFQSDNNVYYGGATTTTWGDAKSIVKASFDSKVTLTSLDDGVTVSFAADTGPTDAQCPLITHDFIGVGTLTKQGIENHDGTPITIDHDLKGTARNATHPTAGPLEALAATNTVTIKVGADLPPGTTGPDGSAGGSAAGGENTSSGGDGTAIAGGAGGTTTGTGGGKGGKPSGGGAGTATGAGADSVGNPGAASSSQHDGGCGCEVPARGPQGSALALGLLAAFGLARRRRYYSR